MGLTSYGIATSGMYAAERGLNVTGHNISNINTQGYTKQQLIQNDARYTDIPGAGTRGLGTDIDELRQLRDTFLDISLRKENSNLSYWEVKKSALDEIQTLMDEPFGVGLQETMNQFWSGWQELVKDPTNLTVRALVRQKGVVMLNAFNQIGDQLNKIQTDYNKEISNRVTEVNDIAKQIATLNVQIRANEISRDHANDYRDQRNLLIDKLSKIVDIDVQENSDNLINVSIGGVLLVSGASTQKLITAPNTVGSSYISPAWEFSGDLVNIKSGELKGLMETRGELAQGAIGSTTDGSPDGVIKINDSQTIPSIKERLNELLNTMATQINAVHSTGYGIDPAQTTGLDFFTKIDATRPFEMGNIQVNPALMDLSMIAASGSLARGDGSNAQKIFDLRKSPIMAETPGITIPLTGAGPAALDYTGGNINFRVVLNGAAQNIALNNIAYADVNALAADIQTKVDAAFGVNNIRVTGDLVSGKLTFTSVDGVSKIILNDGAANNALTDLNYSDGSTNKLVEDLVGFDDFYRDTVSRIGVKAQEAERMDETQGKLVQEINVKKETISGVNMDEEMANMLKYQHAYQASARVLNVIDEMIDNVVNKMGH